MRRFAHFLLCLTAACGLLPRSSAAPAPEPTPAATVTRPAPRRRRATRPRRHQPPPARRATSTDRYAHAAGGRRQYRLAAGRYHFPPGPQLYSAATWPALRSWPPARLSGWSGAPVRIYLDQRGDGRWRAATLAHYGLGRRLQATFTWVWDTTGRVGPQTVIVVASPIAWRRGRAAEQTLTVSVNLLPAEARPQPEPEAQWAEAESACCIFHYLTGTAAARDIDLIRVEADAAFAHVSSGAGRHPEQKVVFTLVSRLMGHGGFASAKFRSAISTATRPSPTCSACSRMKARTCSTARLLDTPGRDGGRAGGVRGGRALQARSRWSRARRRLLALRRYFRWPNWPTASTRPSTRSATWKAGAFIQYLVDRDGWEHVSRPCTPASSPRRATRRCSTPACRCTMGCRWPAWRPNGWPIWAAAGRPGRRWTTCG